ncbi:MAG: response regulator transcription factor [Candidatus Omnitrophica bacterium]|nr:response regulator transcription factor [Candidatus Omnitrophota bacterium]
MDLRTAVIYVVDDDVAMLKSLERLLVGKGYKVEIFSSAQEFLAKNKYHQPACILLDLKMPEITGLDLQKKLIIRGVRLPIIFVSGQGDVPSSVKAMKGGAVDFIVKPFKSEDLLSVVEHALELSVKIQKESAEQHKLQMLLDKMTKREKQVFQLVIKGLLNKQIAVELGISEKTVKVHRGRLMEKLNVNSVAELVRMAGKSGNLSE